jgi:hypothetical protein
VFNDWSEQSTLPVKFVTGDILLSRAQVVAIGSNAQGRNETSLLSSELAYRYPAAFSAFRKHAQTARLGAGDYWIWREAMPWIAFMVVRQTSVGATRARYVDEVVQKLARDWQREGIRTLALSRLGEPLEWPALKAVLAYWLDISELPVVVYEEHVSGVAVPEDWD